MAQRCDCPRRSLYSGRCCGTDAGSHTSWQTDHRHYACMQRSPRPVGRGWPRTTPEGTVWCRRHLENKEDYDSEPHPCRKGRASYVPQQAPVIEETYARLEVLPGQNRRTDRGEYALRAQLKCAHVEARVSATRSETRARAHTHTHTHRQTDREREREREREHFKTHTEQKQRMSESNQSTPLFFLFCQWVTQQQGRAA